MEAQFPTAKACEHYLEAGLCGCASYTTALSPLVAAKLPTVSGPEWFMAQNRQAWVCECVCVCEFVCVCVCVLFEAQFGNEQNIPIKEWDGFFRGILLEDWEMEGESVAWGLLCVVGSGTGATDPRCVRRSGSAFSYVPSLKSGRVCCTWCDRCIACEKRRLSIMSSKKQRLWVCLKSQVKKLLFRLCFVHLFMRKYISRPWNCIMGANSMLVWKSSLVLANRITGSFLIKSVRWDIRNVAVFFETVPTQYQTRLKM